MLPDNFTSLLWISNHRDHRSGNMKGGEIGGKVQYTSCGGGETNYVNLDWSMLINNPIHNTQLDERSMYCTHNMIFVIIIIG